MINVRIEEAPTINAIGRKIWISGQDNEAFGSFWKESHENGLIDKLREIANYKPGDITNSFTFGISCVEKDPSIRAFNFYIATELKESITEDSLENYLIPAAKWAIFTNKGPLPQALVEAEMYAFMEWLPSSEYQHGYAPELEVYPVNDNNVVEFWLPIMPK